MHLVIGASGFLGRSLLQSLGERGIGTYASRPFAGGIPFKADTEPFSTLERRLPSGITHVYLLHGVLSPDLCFKDPERSRAVNVTQMIGLLSAIMDRGITPVFMSTDYVYDGSRGGRREDEPVSPTTSYGRHKAEVEAWLSGHSQPFLVCRSSKIVSGDRDTHSVLGQWINDIAAGKTMRCADDQVFSPGDVVDIAQALIALADTDATGLYHVAGPQALSRHALASLLVSEIQRVAPETKVALERCKLADIPFLEPRPLNTALSTEKLTGAIRHRFTPMEAVCRAVAERWFSPGATSPERPT